MALFDSLSSLSRELKRGLLHLIYPGLCHLCGQSLAPGLEAFCGSCRDGLLGDDLSTCPRCAGTVGPFANTDGGCPSCRGESFAFESVIRLGPYDGLWREAVLRLKHHRGEGLAELLGELWADHFSSRLLALHADCIIPVPLYWRRRWQRGYNQSAALAHGLASVLGLPCRSSWIQRVRHTDMQPMLAPSTRRTNLRGAFRAVRRARVQGATVLLVDDVMTSGATAHEAAAALRQAGAKRIVVTVLCRAGSP